MASLSLGFGIYVFPRILVQTQAQPYNKAHDLHKQGTVKFEGFIAEGVTPNSEFYISSSYGTMPEVHPDAFRLRIEGLVEEPYSLSLKELADLPNKHAYVTLECIGKADIRGISLNGAYLSAARLS
jgi:DMSO/TMAO reductase YedYZ molybdopterin-dependent catalytic subunit